MTEQGSKTGQMCGKCGAEVRTGSRFCFGCGEKILESSDSRPGVRTFEAAKNSANKPRLRSHRIRPESKVVEVTWKRSDGPGLGILVIALVAALIVALLLGTAYYLK